ncbi:hypothetical protein JZ751_011217 [Albula glossodonta]|uniref:Ion transport domain-containing protein n=1 Tax=Albula glossodonta TaxID=121402 RepID=A0A8T2NYE4_9TELE|nr:hypothetical protein JZ751_011217 [Albula glossodonta]
MMKSDRVSPTGHTNVAFEMTDGFINQLERQSIRSVVSMTSITSTMRTVAQWASYACGRWRRAVSAFRNPTEKSNKIKYQGLAQDDDDVTDGLNKNWDLSKRLLDHFRVLANSNQDTDEVIREMDTDIKAQTYKDLQTPLHFAAKNDAVGAIRILLEQGADITAHRSEAARMLLELGADAGVRDSDGQLCITAMINRMAAVAQEALNQFHVRDRMTRQQFYYLHLLEPDLLNKKTFQVLEANEPTSPLESIVSQGKLDLIMHPVVLKLITVKWSLYGRVMGPFIVMLGKVVGDVLRFLFLYIEIFIPYACAFWMIFGDTPAVPSMQTVPKLLYSLYRLTLVDEYEFDAMVEVDSIMAHLLCGTFLALSAVLCVNLMIALLSDTFQRYYIHCNCGPLAEFYDEDTATNPHQHAEMKRITVKIKETLDEFLEINKEAHSPDQGKSNEKDRDLGDRHTLNAEQGEYLKTLQRLQRDQNQQNRDLSALRMDVKEIQVLLQRLIQHGPILRQYCPYDQN